MEQFKRKQFTFYSSFYDAMQSLGVASRGRMIMIMAEYALRGVEPPELTGKEEIFMRLVYPVLRSGREKAIAGHYGAMSRISLENLADEAAMSATDNTVWNPIVS